MDWETVRAAMTAILDELGTRGVRVERKAKYTYAKIYGGQTKPFLLFEVERGRDYFARQWEDLYDFAEPLPEKVVKAATFVQVVVRVQVEMPENYACFAERKELAMTSQSIKEVVDWLLCFDEEAYIADTAARQAQLDVEWLSQCRIEGLWEEELRKRLRCQPTEWLLGMSIYNIAHRTMGPEGAEFQRQLINELALRTREDRWMDGQFEWHAGQHPFTREQAMEAARMFFR